MIISIVLHTHSCVSLQNVPAVKLYLIILESGSIPTEVQCQLMDQETVSTEIEGMMEQFTFTGEGLLHCLQQWASTAVKSQTSMILTINFVYISVSYILKCNFQANTYSLYMQLIPFRKVNCYSQEIL